MVNGLLEALPWALAAANSRPIAFLAGVLLYAQPS